MKYLHLIGAACLLLSATFAGPALAQPHASFPMQPNAYRVVLQKRIDGVWAVIERKLEGHNVSAERKKQIRAMLDDSAKDIWTEFNKAAADRSISREEAGHLRDATRGLRAKVRSKMAAEHRTAHEDKSKRKNETQTATSRIRPERPAPVATTAPPGSRKSPPPASSKRGASASAPPPPSGRPAATHKAPPATAPARPQKKNKHKTSDAPASPPPTVARPPGADESGE